MNAMPDSFVVNSCQYTPVYLIQDPGASQGQSYIITQSNVEDPKPISDNLKAFYESSGNIEGFVNVNSSPKPRILKKQDSGAVGNNLKLASFLQPKNESLKQQYLMNSMIVKPNVTLNNTNGITSSTTYTTGNNTRLNIDSKIVKLKDVALKTRFNRIERVPQPKNNKPKDVVTAVIPVAVPVTAVQVPINIPTVPATVITTAPAPTPTLPNRHTSVQLLKLGETYHSLNQLSDEQMKMVTQALKIFSNPEKIAPEPTYDPVTNTKFIYKVVSPKDLTVVGKNKVPRQQILEAARIESIMTKELKREIMRETAKKEYVQEAYRKEHSKENAEKELLERYRAKQDKFVAEARAEKLRAEARTENVFKAEAKREMMMKAEAKREKAKAEAKKKEIKKEEMKEELIMREAEEKFMNLQKEILDEQEAKEGKTKVTRSGRKVKLPKPILPEKTPHKPKKKTTLISCFQCSAEFNSLYRLQKHYESHPTHIPSKIHSNLFHCLLAIVLSGAEGDRTNIFLQQLQQLVVKLRSLLPCLLTTEDTPAATVSEDVGSLLGLYPGKYTFDITALDCVKNTEGYCRHNPPPQPPTVEPDTAANQTWATISEDPPTVNKNPTSELEIDDCARINSVENWPTVNKRVWKQKQRKSAQENAKRMRLASENNDTLIELGIDDFVSLSTTSSTTCAEKCSVIISPQGAEHKADSQLVNDECAEFEEHSMKLAQEPESLSLPSEPEPNDYLNPDPVSILPDTANLEQIASTIANLEEQNKKNNHLQFHSAHFDIRSSPIKPTSTVFRKFQINPELLAKYETQVIRSIGSVDKDHETSLESNQIENMSEPFKEATPVENNDVTQDKVDSDVTSNHLVGDDRSDNLVGDDTSDHLVGDDTLGEIFRDEDLSAVKESFILDRELKDWILNRSNDDKSEDGFGKPNTLIEPSLIHVKDHEIKSLSDEIAEKVGLQPNDNHDESSVLNFLDSFGNDSLSFPGTEIRTNGDFQMDLFSFNSS